MKRGFRRIVFEFLSIVVAVLLALFLTEARQEYLNKRQAERSFRAIQNEIQSNYDLIKLDSVAHLKKLEETQQWLRTDPESRDTLGFNVEIIHSLTRATAWEVAKLNMVVQHMPDTLVMDISRVYTVQEFYDQNGQQMYEQLTGVMATVNNWQISEGGMNAFQFEVIKEANMVIALKRVYEEFLKKYPILPSD